MTEIGVEAEFALREPCLRYHRLENDFPESYSKTKITTVAFIALGCMNGTVNVLDHLGNLIQNGSFKKHFRPINQVCISADGNSVFSCADDGFVFIYNLSDPQRTELVNLSCPIKAMAISPAYSKSEQLVTGGKAVILHSRGIFGRRTSEKLYCPPGGVKSMTWRGNILIWADDAAVHVYNVSRKQLVNYIPKASTNSDFLGGHLNCHLVWHSDSCFLVGWEKIIQVCYVLRRSSPTHDATWNSTSPTDDCESLSSQLSNSTVGILAQPKQYVQIAAQFDLGQNGYSSAICGIATHQNHILVLLRHPKSYESLLVVTPEDEKSPQLLVADVGDSLINPPCLSSDLDSVLFVEDAFETISLEDIDLKLPPGPDFSIVGLATIPGEDTHLIYSTVDLIYAQPLSADDRIDWFLEQDMPCRALQIANECQSDLVRHIPKQLGMDYLDKLIAAEDYRNAADLCKLILTDKKSWEEQIYRFIRLGQLHVLVAHLPSSKDLISPSTCEVVLIELLNKSPQLFLQKLKNWPPNSGLYSLSPIITAIQEKTSWCSPQDMFNVASQDPEMNALWRALIVLYENDGHPEKGFEIAIGLKDPAVFDLLRHHLPPGGWAGGNLGMLMRKQLIPLCQIDTKQAILLMIDFMPELPVDFIIQELDSRPLLLFKYLKELNNRNPQAALPHMHRLVKLYASYCREQLLPFLRSTHHYPLNEALTLCQSLNYVPETVYLLTRVGRRKDALRLLMEKGAEDALLLGNKNLTPEQRQAEVAAQAIAYCLEEDSSQRGTYFTSYDHVSGSRGRLLQKRSRLGIDDGDSAVAAETRVDDGRASDRKYDSYEMGAERVSEVDLSPREGGDLWNQVVLFAVDKPSFICALLKHASTERIDPSLLLRKIALKTEIPHLKESLVNLLHNTQIQIELRRNCENILLKDLHEISSRLVRAQNRGVFVDLGQSGTGSSAVCRVCRQTLLSACPPPQPAAQQPDNDFKRTGIHQPPLLVFRCSHVFHQACLLRSGRLEACPVCAKQ